MGRKLPGKRQEFGRNRQGKKILPHHYLMWLCWEAAANESPPLKFPDIRENTGNLG
jgi:hypothetical protein